MPNVNSVIPNIYSDAFMGAVSSIILYPLYPLENYYKF